MDTSPRPLALVTGASGGIGAALARELARHGHDLVLAARGVAAMEALAGELREGGAAATVIAADLAKPGAAASLADGIARRGLAIDTLVNNAGLGAAGLGRPGRGAPRGDHRGDELAGGAGRPLHAAPVHTTRNGLIDAGGLIVLAAGGFFAEARSMPTARVKA